MNKHFPTFSKAWNRVKRIFARFEAAYQRWGEMSWLPSNVQDGWIDVNSSTRQELVRRHRYWVKNSPIVNRLRCLFIQYSVGTEGLLPVPNSSVEAWNVVNEVSYGLWCEHPELHTNFTMSQLQTQNWAGALFDDGEFFIYLTSDNGQPMIQTIASHRVGTPNDLKGEEGKTIFDGIKVDDIGRPVIYFVRLGMDPKSEPKPIPAAQIIHVFKCRFIGQMRGIPEGYSCMNTLHNRDDFQLMEMKAAKAASRITNVYTTASGELDTANARRAKIQINTNDAAGNPEIKNIPQYFNVSFGGESVSIKSGEKIEQFCPTRPTIVTQGYWDMLLSEICCGYNQPKLLVMPYSIQGTVTRADLEVCKGAYRVNFEVLKYCARLVYEYRTKWAAKYDRSFAPLAISTPKDYLNCVIRPPRAPDVDVGRNANALGLELEIGTVTYQDVFAERQQNWRNQFRQSAEAAAYLKQLAVEFSVNGIEVKPEEIANKLQESIKPVTAPIDPNAPKEDVAS